MAHRSLVVAALLLSACFRPTTEDPLTPPEQSTVLTEEVRSCHAGKACVKAAGCCSGYFCDNATYGPAKCAAARANGAYCFSNTQCKSKICEGGSCVAKACTAAALACSQDSDCCSGTFCDDLTYGPAKCRAPQANGAFCTENNQCQTNICRTSSCASACFATGHTCSKDPDCCGGSFCNNFNYGPWKCTAPLANGESCLADTQCHSGHCQAGACVNAVCGNAGTACTTAGDCCGGTFCNNFTYGVWQCKGPQANGAACTADPQCLSGSCQSGSCAAAACANSGTTCSINADCCAGTFCFNYTYAPPTCKTALANGNYCINDAQCLSNRCRSSLCVAAACVANGDACQGDTDCCVSSYCKVGSPYLAVPASCAAAGSTSAYCNTNRQCVSLNCVNHACAP